jgi:hypothetical protein
LYPPGVLKGGSAELARLVHDVERHRRGQEIANAGHKSEHRIETEAEVEVISAGSHARTTR